MGFGRSVTGRKGYPPELRRRALDLVAAGKSVREVARLLEVSEQSIDTWRRLELIDRASFPGSARRSGSSCARRAGGSVSSKRSLRCIGDQRSCAGGGAPKRRFQAIELMAREGLPAEVSCRVLGVSYGGFYAWRRRPPSARAIRHAWPTDLIREVHQASYGNDGGSVRDSVCA